MEKRRFTQVCVLDTCLPDFFSGYTYPVIAVPMRDGMTKNEFAEAIKSEVNQTYDYLCNQYAFTEDEVKMFDEYADSLLKEENEVIFTNEDEDEDDLDPVYTYISLCKPVYKYGMMFLNE